MHFLHTVLDTFFLVLLKRICSIIKTSCLVIISNILMTSLFYQAVSLLGEIGCWSLVINQVFDHAHLLCGFGGSILSLMYQGHPATVSSQMMH